MRLQKPDWLSAQWWNRPYSKKPHGRASGSIAEAAPEGFQVALRQLSRRERWLWISLAIATSLAAIAFLLAGFPAPNDGRYQWARVTRETAAPALLGLLLILNFHVMHCRALLQRERKLLLAAHGEPAGAVDATDLQEVDPLTGLLNRAAATPRLEQELAAAKRAGKPLSVLVVDIDDFGRVNTRYGQAIGDRVLQEFATQLRRATRGVDTIIRMGDDEFLAVLPECAVPSVQRVIDRINPLAVNCGGDTLEVTCTASSFDHHHSDSAEHLLKRAQEMVRLYKTSPSVLTH